MKYIAIDLKKNIWYETNISHIANHVVLPAGVGMDTCIDWIEKKLKEKGTILRGNSAKEPLSNNTGDGRSHRNDGMYLYLAIE